MDVHYESRPNELVLLLQRRNATSTAAMSEIFEVVPHSAAQAVSDPTSEVINEKDAKKSELGPEITPVSAADDTDSQDKEEANEDVIIITGEDAALHLLPMRDDFQPALTFRSLFLASGLSAFQAVMSQIYQVSEHRSCTARCCCYVHTSSPPRMLRCPLVQTDRGHHLGDLHRSHCLLPRQRLG